MNTDPRDDLNMSFNSDHTSAPEDVDSRDSDLNPGILLSDQGEGVTGGSQTFTTSSSAT